MNDDMVKAIKDMQAAGIKVGGRLVEAEPRLQADYKPFEASPSNEALTARFRKAYANVPLALRNDIIAVLDDEPMTWHVVKLEIDNDTEMATRILKYLNSLELI